MRFADGEEEYPGQWWLWENALTRAISGKRGQQVLRDLEQALLELPEQELIDGRLSDGAGVCAVGAYILSKRVAAGEEREDVLRDLVVQAGEFDGWEAEDATITKARRAGMQLTLAVTIAGLNDELYKATPAQRYEWVLGWVRKRQLAHA